MSLASGDTLGPYEIVALIGKGGMGEVYRARDPRVGRDVAIKVSAERFTERFEREAKAIAALNHPNICTLYDVGPDYLVMELVEGESPSGPLPLDEALSIARQIGAALEEAHEKNIVHRDLKPGNIKVKPDGTVKVLDFGLAKVGIDPAAQTENSPTLSMAATQAGVILGTAGYMSPEQTRGKTVDKRADIWAFGVVLYELLTGRRLFEGEDLTETLAKVIQAEPRWEGVSSRVLPLLKSCLQKDPKKRLRDIGDAWRLLETSPAAEPLPFRQSRLPWAVAAFAIAVAGVALWGWLRPANPPPRLVTRFRVPLPKNPNFNPIALSRDGSRVAFSVGANQPIYVRRLDELEPRPLPGTEGGVFPAFSPDGQWLVYLVGGGPFQMKKVPAAGGTPLTILEGVPATTPLSWEPDDTVLYSVITSVLKIPSGGGAPQTLLTADTKKGELAFLTPRLLPGGKQMLVSAVNARGMNAVQVLTVNLQTGEKRVVLDGAGVANFAATGGRNGRGYLVYGQGASLFAAPFDPNAPKAGAPAPLFEGVLGVGALSAFGLSESGTLAYLSGGSAPNVATFSSLVWVDSQGQEQLLPAPVRPYNTASLSPDGARVAVGIFDLQRLANDIWLYDIGRGSLARLTFEGSNTNPVWTSDRKRIIYAHGNNITQMQGLELRSVPADGSGAPSTLLSSEAPAYVPVSISSDGKFVIGVRMRANQGGQTPQGDLWVMSLGDAPGSKPKPQPFLDSQFLKAAPQFSPDGKWVAYQSNESGRNEIYAVPFPGPGGKAQISTDGGATPRWARSGRTIFYQNGGKLLAVDVETAPVLRAGTPRMLFDKPGMYDVAPDGKRFLFVRQSADSQGPPAELNIVVNWFDELRARVPQAK